MANTQDLLDAGQCDISALARIGAELGLNALDPIDYQSLKVYILAQLVYAESGGDYDLRDICELARGMKQYDKLSDYQQKAAMIEQLMICAENAGVTLDQDDAKAKMQCAHCCDITAKSLFSAEICLWNLLCQVLPRD